MEFYETEYKLNGGDGQEFYEKVKDTNFLLEGFRPLHNRNPMKINESETCGYHDTKNIIVHITNNEGEITITIGAHDFDKRDKTKLNIESLIGIKLNQIGNPIDLSKEIIRIE